MSRSSLVVDEIDGRPRIRVAERKRVLVTQSTIGLGNGKK
jgi:hypothetical protein